MCSWSIVSEFMEKTQLVHEAYSVCLLSILSVFMEHNQCFHGAYSVCPLNILKVFSWSMLRCPETILFLSMENIHQLGE